MSSELAITPTTVAVPGAPAVPEAVERMSIVIGGHVDHGKSTIIARLLADTHSLPQGKLEQVRAMCERSGRPFEYAFLLDALKDEQAQGITIEAARVFFKTAKRYYIIIDAPGHLEFLKNLVTGAARADAALLAIDAQEGLKENSRRHGYMMSMLGIRQLAVLINKMDLVARRQAVFESLVAEYQEFLRHLDIVPMFFIPVCGRDGDNIAHRAASMPWYTGPTVIESLDEFRAPRPQIERPFRMPVQDVYKFTSQGDDRRIVAGTIEAGAISVRDEIVFYPSGKKARVKSIEAFNRTPPDAAFAGTATGFTLEEQVYVTRGEIAARAAEPRPRVTTRLRVSLFWLGKEPMIKRKDYLLKCGTARALARLEDIHRVIDTSSLRDDENKSGIERHDVAECTLVLNRALAVDLVDEIPATSRFVIVDDYDIRGGGVIREALPDEQTWVRDKVLLRNVKWEPGIIGSGRRAEKYSQKATLVLITGARDADRKTLAKNLEGRLFDAGRIVYFLGIANVLYGVDADIDRKDENRREHLRRLAEVAHLILDAGVILIVAAAELTQDDLELIKTAVDQDRIETIWVGDTVTTDIHCDLLLNGAESDTERVDRVKVLLQDKGMIFRSW